MGESSHDPIPEAERRPGPADGKHQPEDRIAAIAAQRWTEHGAGALDRGDGSRAVAHGHLFDADSQYNPTRQAEQVRDEGDLSLLLHHKLGKDGDVRLAGRSPAAMVEYYGEDGDTRGGFASGERRDMPWEEDLKRQTKWRAGMRAEALPPSPARPGPGASPRGASHSRSFVSDSNGTMLLGEDAEALASRTGGWSTNTTPQRSPGSDSQSGDSARRAELMARRQLGGDAGGLSASARRTASASPRPSPSLRAVPRLAHTKPDADYSAAEEETAFLLGQAYKLGLGGMLDMKQLEDLQQVERLALAVDQPERPPRRTQLEEGGGMRRHQAPPAMYHVRQPQVREMDWMPTHTNKHQNDLVPRRHRSLAKPKHAGSLAAPSDLATQFMTEHYTMAVDGDITYHVDGSPTSGRRGRMRQAPGSPGSPNAKAEKKELETLKRKLQGLSYSHGGQDPEKLFRTFDRDNSGELDELEFKNAVRKGGKITSRMLDDAALSKLFSAVDVDGDGSVGIDELTGWVWGGDRVDTIHAEKQAQVDSRAMDFIRRGGVAPDTSPDNTVMVRRVSGARGSPHDQKTPQKSVSGLDPLDPSDEEEACRDDVYAPPPSEDGSWRPGLALVKRGSYRGGGGGESDDGNGMGLTPGSARERGRLTNERHRAELEARQSKKRAKLAQKQAKQAREHSSQLAHANALAMQDARGRLEQEATVAAEEEMRLYRARLAVTRWKQRLVRYWLLRWHENAKWLKSLIKAWSKLQAQITARHVRDGFHGWAVYIIMKKRHTTLLKHAVWRWRSDRLGEMFEMWVNDISYRRRVAQALDRTAFKRRLVAMRSFFFEWCEVGADERRSRWLESRVEKNTERRLLVLMIGQWRIESRALARTRGRKKELEEQADRAQQREADRVQVLTEMAEMLNRRRADPLLQSLPAGALEANMPDPGSPSEAMAQAVVAE